MNGKRKAAPGQGGNPISSVGTDTSLPDFEAILSPTHLLELAETTRGTYLAGVQAGINITQDSATAYGHTQGYREGLQAGFTQGHKQGWDEALKAVDEALTVQAREAAHPFTTAPTYWDLSTLRGEAGRADRAFHLAKERGLVA